MQPVAAQKWTSKLEKASDSNIKLGSNSSWSDVNWITLNRKILLPNQLSPNSYPEITSWMTHALVSRNKQTSSVLHVQIMQIVACTTQLIFFRTKAFTQLYWKRNEHQRSRNWGYQFYSLGPKETTGVLTTIDSPFTTNSTIQITTRNSWQLYSDKS